MDAKSVLVVPQSKPIPSSARMCLAIIEFGLEAGFASLFFFARNFLDRVRCVETHCPSLGFAEYLLSGTLQWPNCALYSHNYWKRSRHWEWRNPPSLSFKVVTKGLHILPGVSTLGLFFWLLSPSVALLLVALAHDECLCCCDCEARLMLDDE